MRILRNRLFLNNRASSRHCSCRMGWYSGEDFVGILNRERNRSDRNGLPLSFILIDLSSLRNGNGKPDGEYHRFLEKVSGVISENTRISDVKYIGRGDKIGILLMDTGLEGTKSYIRKMSRKLHDHLNTNGMSGCADWMRSIDVSVIPIRSAPGHMGLEKLRSAAGLGKSRKEQVQEDESDWMDEDTPDFGLKWRIVQPPDILGGSVPQSWRERDWLHNRSVGHRAVKRSIDIVGSITGIILSLPLMVVISLLIKATSRGPVVFRQTRLGYLTRTFTFLKFRTMRADCDDKVHREYVGKHIEGREDEVNRGSSREPLYKMKDDTRITRFGKFLRKTSLDELPQFFNVLMGTMSLVGPRPPIPYEAERYQDWHWKRIMEAKPGITGLWQVYGRSRTTHADMVRLDLRYIRNESLLLDLKIILKTFFAIFNTKGAL